VRRLKINQPKLSPNQLKILEARIETAADEVGNLVGFYVGAYLSEFMKAKLLAPPKPPSKEEEVAAKVQAAIQKASADINKQLPADDEVEKTEVEVVEDGLIEAIAKAEDETFEGFNSVDRSDPEEET
jgi:hypothetical protein